MFADTSLAAAVCEALKKPAGPLTQEEFLSLAQLAAGGRGIVRLAGIDSLKSLQFLDLENNQIQTSPLSRPCPDRKRLPWASTRWQPAPQPDE